MVFLLLLLTAGYLFIVVWVLRRTSGAAGAGAGAKVEPAADLPDEDLPPSAAVGWPPTGSRFEAYVENGFAALDAYLSEGSAP